MSANDRIRSAIQRGYHVDVHGDVVSPRGNVLSARERADGRLVVTLRGAGTVGPVLVHRLAAYQKFGERALSGLQVRHMDNNPTNNAPDNLELGTAAENMADIDEHQRGQRALAAGRASASLSDDQVKQMRLERERGATLGELAQMFAVSTSTVSRVCSGERYQWVK